MDNLTGPLHELRAAYRAYQNAKRDKKEEITEKYAARIADEVRKAVDAEKYAFASRLRDVKEAYGLRVTDIQDHVLRTRNWKVWEDIRDFADIAPEQVLRSNARAEAQAAAARAALVFEWVDGLLKWYRHPETGEELNRVLTIRYRDRYGAYWGPHQYSDAATRDDVVGSLTYGLSGGGYALYKAVKEEVLTNGGNLPDAAEDLETADLETVADNPWMENMT